MTTEQDNKLGAAIDELDRLVNTAGELRRAAQNLEHESVKVQGAVYRAVLEALASPQEE